MKHLLLFLFCISLSGLNAQKNGTYKQKKNRKQHFSKRTIDPLYSYSRSTCRPLGIHFSLGATYTFTDLNPKEFSAGTDTVSTYKHDPYGRLGYYFDIGMVHIFKNPGKGIHYWDWALGMKQYGGGEEFKSGVSDSLGNALGSANGKGKWDNGYVFARANIHSVVPIGKYNFFDFSLGVNLDYQVYEYKHNRTYEGQNIATNEKFTGKFLTSLHFRLGFGIKLKEGLFLVPFAELPIFTGYEWNSGKPTIQWFSSWYLPFTVGVKLAILFKKDPNACPPVYNGSGDAKKSDQYQQQK